MNKTWPTIYARSNTGAILEWYIEQIAFQYRSISGQQNGQKVVSAWTSASPKNIGKKNATTAEQQASIEIQAKYDKQLKSGGYWYNLSDIDKARFFQVMLAKQFSDYQDGIDWASGVGVQIKYNGGRILACREGLFTRKGERYVSIPHVENALKPFFAAFPNAILDGEGYNYELRTRLNEIMKLLRKTVHITEEDLEKSKNLIRFYVYDGFGFPKEKDGEVVGQEAGYLDRKAAIDNAFFAPCFAKRYSNIIGVVPTWVVHSQQEVELLYQHFLGDNQEGAIIRLLNKPYECKRSSSLLKYKPVDDDEFVVVEVEEGVGKFAGRVSTFICRRVDGKMFNDGTYTFRATFKGYESDAIDAWTSGKAKKLIGKVVTVLYNGLTGFGKPNYARIDWLNYNTKG